MGVVAVIGFYIIYMMRNIVKKKNPPIWIILLFSLQFVLLKL